MAANDALRGNELGGGGYGNPRDRARATVADDVRNGYVSREAAQRDYGMTAADLP